MMKKCGFVTIIGRPNVGKSTLLNQILGQKVVIATDKPQTTRRRIKGIFTDERGQIIFIDTPGIYKSWDKFGELLFNEAKVALPDSDLILFVVDTNDKAGKGDKWIAENLLNTKTPVILVCNKTELIKDTKKRDENVQTYKDLFKENIATVKISAKTGRNKDTLLDNIFKKLPVSEMVYDEDELTDESMRKIAQEIIREKILLETKDEIPHCVAVIIESYVEMGTMDKIYATIIVEQNSQKLILVGKDGSMIKKIGTQARIELEEIADRKIFLSLNVKVVKNWRKKYDKLEELL